MKRSEKKAYLPFHAVNEFMRDDFRLVIIQDVLSHLDHCKVESRSKLIKLINKSIHVPGFRNSSQAPLGIKVKNSQGVFTKSTEFAAAVMECWSQIHIELRKKIYDLLIDTGWKIPGESENRAELPGFQLDWPEEQNFDFFIQAIRQNYSEIQESDDEISLMVVWVGNRLPNVLNTSERESTIQ